MGEKTVVILAAGQGTRISVWKRSVPKPLIRLCGMPLIERTIRSAKRAGFENFVVVTGFRGDEIKSHLGDGTKFGVQIQYADNPEWRKSNGVSVLAAEPFISSDEFVLMMSDHLVDQNTFKKVAKISLKNDELALVCDSKIDDVFDLDDATKVRLEGDRISEIGKEISPFNAIDTGIFVCSKKLCSVLSGLYEQNKDVSLSEGVRALAAEGKARSEDIGDGWWQDVDAAPAYRHAENMLLQAQRKPTDVFVSRVFNRPISLFLSKYLSRTSVRPDVISFVGMAFGFISPLFLIQGEYWSFVMGAFMYHFSSVLDGCDGEIARLKYMESKRGEWVDTIADVITHILFASGISVGLYVSSGSLSYLAMGAMAIFGMTSLLYVMFQYLIKVANRGSLLAFDKDYSESVSGIRDFFTNLAKLLKPLIRRATFAFMFFLLAIVGRIDVVLFLMAFGTNVALALVYMTFRKKVRLLAMSSQERSAY